MADTAEPEHELVQAPRINALQDEAWITQQRVFEEIPEVQPERLQFDDFLQESETKSSVIVPNANQYTRVKWEFPEEEEKDRETVPRVRAQEWVPANDVEHAVLKTTYAPSRIQRAWPPPGYGEDVEPELESAQRSKAQDDTAWIQQNTKENDEEEAVRGNAPWRRQVNGAALKDVAWPPPEPEKPENGVEPGPRMSVQWPPADYEDRIQQEVQVLQTHYRTQKLNAPWPPVQPGQEPNPDEPLTVPELRFSVNAQQQPQSQSVEPVEG